MSESQGLMLVAVLGAAAQWLSWRLRIPAILLLLLSGVLAGPVLHILDVDALLGHLLLPVVSLSVALILFEGGLSLELKEIQSLKGTITSLVTVGAAVSWLVSTAAAHHVLAMPWGMSLLLGAILSVTGPTVIGPLLRQIRPRGPTAAILKWEGIVIDPIGAMLALLVFNVLIAQSRGEAVWSISTAIVLTITVGLGGGWLAGRALHQGLRRHWIPEYLQNPFVLAAVIGAFVLSNMVQSESGLLTVTVMGAVLANQHTVVMRHIVEFKENLRVLLISSIFILLAARVDLHALIQLGWGAAGFLAVLILVGRPLAIFLATAASGELSLKDRLFLSWMAPRGVVAAAVSSVFALELQHNGVSGADLLVSVSFAVIVGTVLLYGLTAGPLARRLGLAGGQEQGLVLLGAAEWVRALARVLQKEGVPILLVDSNRQRIQKARMEGLPAQWGDVLSEVSLEELNLSGMGAMLALTPSSEVNRLAALHFSEIFGRSQVYRLSSMSRKDHDKEVAVQDAHGRVLFERDMTHSYLLARLSSGSSFKATRLTETFDLEAFQKEYGGIARPLMTIEEGRVRIGTVDEPLEPQAGAVVVSLVDED